MTPQLERFIELAVRPLKNRPDDREEARSELMGRLSHLGVPVDQLDVSEPTTRLEAAPQRPTWPRRVTLLSATLILAVIAFGGATLEFFGIARMGMASRMQWGYGYYNDGSGEPDFWDRVLFGWADREAPDRPLDGNGAPTEVARLRAAFPEDLAILQECLRRPVEDREEFMTDEERALIDRLDPDNALWPMMEMRWNLEKGSGGGWSPYGRSAMMSAPDPDAQAKAWKLFDEAAQRTRFVNHAQDLQRRQIDAFSTESTIVGGMLRDGFGHLPQDAFGGRPFYFYGGVDDTLQRHLDDVVAGSEPEKKLRELFVNWQQVMRLRVSSANAASWEFNDLQERLAQDWSHFRDKFFELAMTDEVQWFDARIPIAPFSTGLPPELESEAGFRVSQTSMPVPANLTVEELKPGRKAEQAWLGRTLTWPAAGFVLLLVLLVGFESNRRHAIVQGMARGLMPLSTMRDHVWIGAIGILLPWVYWWCVSRLTPMGFPGPDFEDEWFALAWVLQATLGLVTGLVLLVQVVQWRWGKVGEFLGLKRGASWLGWIAGGITGLAVPAVGLIRFLPLMDDEDKALFLGGCAGAGAVGLLWLLWVGGMNLFTPRHSALQANLVSRTLRPWALLGLASLLLAGGILRLAESSWYQRDPLLPTWTSDTFANALDERLCTERQEQLKEILAEEFEAE